MSNYVSNVYRHLNIVILDGADAETLWSNISAQRGVQAVVFAGDRLRIQLSDSATQDDYLNLLRFFRRNSLSVGAIRYELSPENRKLDRLIMIDDEGKPIAFQG